METAAKVNEALAILVKMFGVWNVRYDFSKDTLGEYDCDFLHTFTFKSKDGILHVIIMTQSDIVPLSPVEIATNIIKEAIEIDYLQ